MASGSRPEQSQSEASHCQPQNVLEDSDKPSQKKPLPHILDYGVTELWCPPAPIDVLADICFVHGLKGHPFRTWYDERGPGTEEVPKESRSKKFRLSIRSKGKQNAESDGGTTQEQPREHQGCYWPLDLIPNNFHNVRVITYAYDSHPSHFYAAETNQMTITQHAQNLLQKLTNNRVDCLTRPIIFVAHSLGGILVKDAIVQSERYDNHLKSLSQSSYAIFFFGTPHRGSSAARYGEILSNVVGALPGGPSMYKEVLRGLKPNGEKLSLVEGDFNQLLNRHIPADEKIQIYSFQEGKPLNSVKLGDGKVVPDSSSFFNRKDIEQNSFVDENHRDMARFRSARSSTYNDFSSALKGFLARIQARREHARSAAQEAERARLAVFWEIIDFKDRCVRQQQLSSLETIQKTFDWIWSSAFKAWLEGNTSFFWISGKPASGKSTIMNHIAVAEDTIQILEKAHNKQWKVIYFFFDFRARDGISNNMEGFVRCLLYQLCKDLPNLAQNVPELRHFIDRSTHDQSAAASERHIPIKSLKKALLQCLQNCSENIIILLDGLDEYEGQKVELTNFIQTLCLQNVKICTASRPDPPFPDAFASMPTILMQELNFDAIKSFCLDVLKRFYSSRQYEPEALQYLAREVARRSQGVFLWARFAIYELIDGLSHGESLGSPSLERRLAAIPEELEQIYSRIFQRLAPAHRKLTAFFLLLICHTVNLVNTEMLARALCYAPSTWADAVEEGLSHALETDDEIFSRRLLAVTGGIVEVFQAKGRFCGRIFDSSWPRLIHRTASAYLESEGWKLLLGDMFTPGLGHDLWIQICVEAITRAGSNLTSRFPHHSVHYEMSFDIQAEFGDRYGNDSLMNDVSSIELEEANQAVPRSDTFLLAYAALKVLEHAARYEALSAMSSRKLLSPCFTTAFMQIHLNTSMCYNNGSCTHITRLSQTYDIQIESVNYAVVHNLFGFVDGFLQEHQKQQQQKPNTGQKILGQLFSLLGRGKINGSATPFTKRLGLLKALLMSSVMYERAPDNLNDDDTIAMYTLLIKYGATIEDHDLFLAVRYCTLRVLSWLLGKRQSLAIPNLDLRLLVAQITLLSKEYYQGNNLTIMAAFGLRATPFNLEDREILHRLRERGFNIYDRCGPLGGVLHYAMIRGTSIDDVNGENLEMLIEEGADVNLEGSHGKPLEFYWQLVNSTCLGRYILNDTRRLIAILLYRGAINVRKDPNGLVPSEIQMRLFACNSTDHQECSRYYREGPRDGGRVWPGPVPLDPKDEHSHDDIPYEIAIKEYRAAMGIETPLDETQETAHSASGEDVPILSEQGDTSESSSDRESYHTL